jgi:UDP-N-acetylmuramoyl-L-alanyl-D-glutamate--2,6-diaminopimelate ligase
VADDVLLSASGVKYVYSDGKRKRNVRFGMPGLFNVSNSLAVIACCETLGFDVDEVIKALAGQGGVRGRAEIVPTHRDFTVICDYAHTPDALANVLKAIKESSTGKVKCLFGCGGNRDATKRPLMAAAAADNSDFLIVTSDNPRNEDPEEIIKDILVGLEGKDTPYVKICDRREAIHWAIKNAEKDDIIVLAGKGHEDYQILAGGVKIHFDEREVVAEALDELSKQGR